MEINNKKSNFSTGGVLLLVGPPGVGKTSLAQSIASSLKRKFIKISVGGVTDESEIKGNRRTYIGSYPGMVINAMKKVGTLNPVILVDEIDKIGSRGYHGNPQSALLEVLDSNENSRFIDSYLGIPYDLSNVMFICTANSLERISGPLLDRMEVIRLSSYTYLEKIEIAKKYLIPKVIEKFAIDSKHSIIFNENSIYLIIKHYTQEAGVRELKRLIETICRKFIVKILDENLEKLEVNENIILEFLGEKIFDNVAKSDYLQSGVVNGLAYTEFGGDILNIEVGFFKGSGKVVLTGTLGDVMKESANIAIDYIKQNYDLFEIDPKKFTENDIHIHVPEGATPKDGPSGGIAITTAVISALKNVKIPYSIAMTGEITLRGKVIPIGGLREKIIAANSNGIETVIIPEENKHNLTDIPKEVLNKVNIFFVKEYNDVWNFISKKIES